MKRLQLFLCLILVTGNIFAQDDVMYVHYINVGQGNAALLEFPCGAVLIDAGGQDDNSDSHLISYLEQFFAERPDLYRTLDLVLVTHNHLDHNRALFKVVDRFTVKRYIDNGQQKGSGYRNQVRLQEEAESRSITYASYTYETITKNNSTRGMTNRTIDPLDCETVNPKIILYSGAFSKKPAGWSDDDFIKNGNNHSLFIKVLFGASSFLFIGDAETAEMGTVVDHYTETDALNADVLMVGHHGAKNATTYPFLDAVTPRYAVISCGKWYDDSTTSDPFNTYHYGHPTDSAIKMLTARIPGDRAHYKDARVGLGAKNFIDKRITKRIYATPWDNDVIIRATSAGKYKAIVTN